MVLSRFGGLNHISSGLRKIRTYYLNKRFLSAMSTTHIKTCLDDSEITKSAGDDRQYRALELQNGMRVLLISDKQTDKSSAAMDVYIGHMKDPKDIPGLAHFCEHMLFLGTKKYPEENEYTKFLNEHAGSSNAFTSNEHTNFFFDIAPEYLSGALERFSQFFLEPLFTPSATEREINAVNSENDKNLQNDSWRFHQLEKSLANPKHDFSKFGTGNKYTLETRSKELGYDVRDELLKFHDELYSSNLMGLTVLGKESLDELMEIVVPHFHGVENKNVAIPRWNEHPYGPAELQNICYVTPVKDIRNLTVSWSIPDLQPYYKTNPGHYLGHLIGHEGKGSLLSELKVRGWVNTLVGGQQQGANGFMFFMVNVDLTADGLEHIDDIITLIYQYLHMLNKEGAQEWIFKECADLSAMHFRFKDKERPRGYTSALSGVLHDVPLKECLSSHYLMTEYKPELIDMLLSKLIPTNMRVSVVAKKFAGQTDKKEEWYGTEYKLEQIPQDKLKMWDTCGFHENLSLPAVNEFIPTNFDLVSRETDQNCAPAIIQDSGMTRLWFKQDDKFHLPKAYASFELTSPLVYIDPLHTNMAVLFVQLFQDSLNEYAYDAELAGLKYNLNSTAYGVTLSVKGYSDKLHVLLKKILEKMVSFKIDPKRYHILKELYGRSLKNFYAEQPHQHAVYFTSVVMSELLWTQVELLNSLEEVTLEKLTAFLPQLFSKMYIEGLVYGNITKQKSVEMTELIENILREQVSTKELLPSQRRRLREIQLPDGCYYIYQETNSVHKSSSIEIYYQCGQQATNTNMLLELFVQIISEPCFNILRTKEQLGYIVFSGIRRQSGVQGLRVIVQSDRTPEYVEGRIEAFLHSIEETLNEMSDTEFQKHVSALATKRLEKPKKMSAQATRYWSEIVSEQYNFDRDNVEVAFLRGVTKEDLIKFYKDNIAYNAPKRHKLSVHILSTASKEETGSGDKEDNSSKELQGLDIELPKAIIVEDVNAFKRDMALYPLAKPFIDLQKARSKL
ncbi:insulin-degrading enzyme-like [Mercenaria mercenaria]|uniref:insulin-degrading enzyme-like n=1 Tax=Mercenaria mercenaria TaxID=6596 RepID=UPI00234E7414|nr:insulin-degrading enzyme-like [Mercenaria mercenaria]